MQYAALSCAIGGDGVICDVNRVKIIRKLDKLVLVIFIFVSISACGVRFLLVMSFTYASF